MDEQASIQWANQRSGAGLFVARDRFNPSRAKHGRSLLLRLRRSRGLAWLGNRATFAIGMPTLSVLAFATSLYIPRLVPPAEFGAYALLLTLFRYAGDCDLGLSQLADQRLAALVDGEAESGHILAVRFRVGLIILLAGVPAAGLIGFCFGLSPIDAVIAVTAGLCAMVAGGPSTVFRARGRIWEYTAFAFLFGIGFIAPRLLGFAIDGVTGCFALWLVWYGAIAAFSLSRFFNPAESVQSVLGTLRASIPLFMFASVWTLYVAADRWVAAVLSSSKDLGLFALGANIAAAGIVTFGQISDVRYPNWLKRISLGASFELSRAVEREAHVLGALATAAVALAMPAIPFVVLHVFPSYAGADQPMIALAVSCVPTIVVAWFLPVAIARSHTPIADAWLIFGPAFAVMAAGMVIGNRFAGITGQAWGCGVSAIVLLSGLAVVLHRNLVVDALSAARTVAVSSLMVGALALQAFFLVSPMSSAKASQMVVPPLGWTQTFCDTFENLAVWTGLRGTWQPSYLGGIRTNKTNRELEFYASPFDRAIPASLQPFQTGKDGLTITARRVPQNALRETGGLPYVSGLLNSAHSFSFTYGYAVMRARVPKGRGLWPAFWLLPTTGQDPPELDVMENLGHEPATYYATLHSAISGISMNTIPTVPLDGRLHDYGVLWTRSSITWFLDGKSVAAVKTPADMHSPMYLLVNLAVGGEWPGSPDAGTVFPARMQVSSISVYQDGHGVGTRRCNREVEQ